MTKQTELLAFKRIYLQMKDYDGSENSEESITWSPIRINKDDIEYVLSQKPTDMPTEEEIEKHFNNLNLKISVSGVGIVPDLYRIQGAKWMRDEIERRNK